MILRLLFAVPSPGVGARLAALLRSEHLLITRVETADAMWQSLARDSFDLVVIEREILTERPTVLIQTIRQLPDHPEVLVLQSREDPMERAKMLADGVMAVLNVGVPDSVLGATLSTLVERRRASLAGPFRGVNRDEPSRLSDFATSSAAMTQLLDVAWRVVDTDTSLVIVGETGVGKEWLARAIHEEGQRSRHQFIAVNCAAVPAGLLESELFGHEKGAFTGSVRARRGYFELAHQGTLFLDEIAETPLHLQATLLRVLQGRTIQRLGAEKPIAVDVRIMAATNRSLDQAMAEGLFRSDLYYRLSVVTLRVPSLRERREDIEPLALGYLRRFARHLGRPVDAIDDNALAALEEYHWPGNVRELINVIERAVLLARGDRLGLGDLPEALSARRSTLVVQPDLVGPGDDDAEWLLRPLAEVRRQAAAAAERRYLIAQLKRHGGRIGDTARACALDPRSLYTKMRDHGLVKEDFRRR